MHDRTNNPATFLVGLLSGVKQTVLRAELLTVICLDEMMEGRDERSDTVISSGCAHLWNRCFKETRRATSSSNADQWGRYRRARARVRCRIDFVKVPARTEIQDVWSGRITARSWGGNLFADSSRES